MGVMARPFCNAHLAQRIKIFLMVWLVSSGKPSCLLVGRVASSTRIVYSTSRVEVSISQVPIGLLSAVELSVIHMYSSTSPLTIPLSRIFRACFVWCAVRTTCYCQYIRMHVAICFHRHRRASCGCTSTLGGAGSKQYQWPRLRDR